MLCSLVALVGDAHARAGVGSEAVSLEMDALRDLVFWVSRRENAQVLAAPIQLSILVNTHRKKVEEEFKQYLQKSLAPKLMMGQSVAVDEAYIRDEFAKYERNVLANEPWYACSYPHPYHVRGTCSLRGYWATHWATRSRLQATGSSLESRLSSSYCTFSSVP